MAEFGLIASAVGVVGVAGQIASGLKKLRDFQQDVKSAPKDIGLLADELEILITTIASIEYQMQRYPTVVPTNPTSALNYCQRAIDATAMIVQDLNSEITKRRTIGSLKAAWKQKTTDSYMTRIERAKSTLALAYPAFLHEHAILHMEDIGLRQQDHVDRRFDQLVTITHTTSTTSHRTSRLESVSRVEERANDTCDAIVTTEHAHSLQYRSRHRTTTIRVAKVRLSLPYWLLSRSLNIEIHRSARGWTMNLSLPRLVPAHCEFFRAGFEMDLPRMRQLLEQGQASVHDVDYRDQTISHHVFFLWGFESMNLQQLEQILDFGLDLNAVDSKGWTPFSRAFQNPRMTSPTMNHLALKILEGQDAEVTVRRLLQVKGAFFFQSSNQYREDFALSMLTRIGLSRTEQFLISRRFISNLPMDIGWLTNWFQKWQIRKRWHECEASVLCHIAGLLAYHIGSDVDPSSYGICGEILMTIIKSSMEREWEACPIVWFLASMYENQQRRHEDLIMLLARYIVLSGTGISLLDLGKVIQKGLGHGSWKWSRYRRETITEDSIDVYPGDRRRIISIAYGEAPADWAIYFVSFLEDAKMDIFREFWDMVEHPERSMPGSWSIEKEDLYYDPDLVWSTEYEEREKNKKTATRRRARGATGDIDDTWHNFFRL